MGSKEVGRKKKQKSSTGLGSKKLQTYFPTRVFGGCPLRIGGLGIRKLNRWQLVE